MKENIKLILKAKTLRQSGVTIGGTFGSGFLGMIFYVWVARSLGPADYGRFSVGVAAMTLVAALANVGTDTGLIRFVGKYLQADRKRALGFVRLGFSMKLILWTGVLIVGWLVTPVIARSVLGKSELTWILRISLVGVGGSMLFSCSSAALQGMQKFVAWGTLMVASNLLRLMALGLLMVMGVMGLKSGYWIFVLAPFFGFLGALVLLPNFWSAKIDKGLRREFFNYNKWVAIFTAVMALSTRLDTFLSTRLLTIEEVGIYSVAAILPAFASQINLALATVVAPKLAGMRDKKTALVYVKKLQLFVLGLALVGLVVGIPLGYLLITRVYGSQYVASFAPFIVLLLAQTVFFVAVPVHTSVIYYFSNPRLFVWISTLYLMIIGFGGWFLIGAWGTMGAAVAVLVAQTVNYIIPAVWVYRKFRV